MQIGESGVSGRSVRYVFTPSSFAERMFYYPTRVGHYFCDRRYQFGSHSEIAMQAGHRLGYMLFLIKQGQLDTVIEGQRAVASSRSLVLFDCQRRYEYRALTDDLEFYWLLLNGGQSTLFYEQLLAQNGAHVFSAGDVMQVQLLFSQLLTYGETARRAERDCSEAIYRMLCLLLTPDGGAGDDWAAVVARAAAFIDERLDGAPTVDEVAAHVGLSASYFTKQFRAHTGYSPHEYLTLQRIHRAKELLVSTHLTVKQIAYETGYRSEDNFIRSFKKKVGVSPGTYRAFPV